VPTLEEIRRSLSGHAPRLQPLQGKRQAGVALVLREDRPEPELLFIERARQEGDPWSGHMAFPGGRVDPGDRDARRAAERETREEVGLSLAGAAYLGRLDDLEGRHAGRPAGLVVSAYVYRVAEPPPLVPNYEVQQTIWFPVQDLRDPARQVEVRPAPGLPAYPGILVGEPERHVVWGLTYRFLELFLALAGKPLPPRWRETS
jgi:8-oxo-dGTP pyrophosphatase MutT (NUDIX family)